MKIKSITLIGFKRLGFGRIKKFHMVPHEFCQLILGINGFGKSMLMKEISPLPGNKNDYYSNGEKIIVIESHHKTYTVKTTYNKSIKCSLIDNDSNTELNPGGTQAVQYELIKDLFGYTDDIHNLLHAKEAFTEMSLKRRREWFIDVSNMNYDFAIYVWNLLKEQLRDVQGSLKESKKRLIQESSAILSKEEKDRLQDEITKVEKELTLYSKHINNTTSNPEELKEILDRCKSSILNLNTTIITQVKKLYSLDKKGKQISLTQLQDNLDTLLSQIQDKDTSIRLLTEEMDKLRKLYHNAVKKERIDRNKLKEEIVSIENTLLQYQKIDFSSKPTDLDNLSTLITHLTYLNNDKPTPLYTLSKEEYERVFSKYKEKENIHEKEKEELSQLRISLKVLQERKRDHLLTCPKCQHEFIPGFNPDEVNVIIQKGKKLKEKIERESPILKDEKNKIEDYRLSIEWYIRYNALKQRFNEYLFILNRVDALNENNPLEGVLERLNEYRLLLDQYLSLDKLSKRKNELSLLLQQVESMDNYTKEDYEKEIESKEEILKTLYREKDQYQRDREILKSMYTLVEIDIPKTRESLQKEIDNISKYEVEYIKSSVNRDVEKITDDLKIMLGEKIRVKNEIDLKQGIISYLQTEIESLEEKEILLKILSEELSPQKGLIAEGLSQFIRVFLSNMNRLIKQIWSYPLVIHLPDTEDDNNLELTFKFPMQVGYNDEKIEDVSLGSSGIKEVIDLAFKITAMKSLKLDHYPLFLDEFGASFDQQHRVNAVNVIKNITDERIHSQLFMVSHYESSYGGLSHCEVCLLSNEITIPYLNENNVNQHVIIETGESHE